MRPLHDRGTFPQEPSVYGTSALGQRLEIWEATGPTDLLLIGGIHGEEPDTSVLLSRALRSLSDRPASAGVICAANPDGLIRGTRANANGVDLNRNFPTSDWRPDRVTHRWSNRHPSEVRLSPGASPGSEPETEALVRLIGRLRPRRIVSLHGHLSCIEDPLDSAFGRALVGRTGLPLVGSIGYATPGSLGTWAAEAGIPIVTWELPPEAIETLYHTQLPVLTDLLRSTFL